jgi:hypothetical protein
VCWLLFSFFFFISSKLVASLVVFVSVFKNFKEHKQFRPPFAAEGIFGGALLAVRSNDFVDFYEWEDLRLVRRIGLSIFDAFISELLFLIFILFLFFSCHTHPNLLV